MVPSLLPTGVINSGLFPVICRYRSLLSGNNRAINRYKGVIKSRNITLDFRCYFSRDANGQRLAKIDFAKKVLYSPTRLLAFCRGTRDAGRCKPFR